jgi:serine protease DegQ
VVDAHGKLIGIATAGLTRTAAIAIPAETVERVVDTLLRNGHIARGFLGVGLQPVRLPAHLKSASGGDHESGLMILSVEPGSPAEKGGLFIGDTLLTFGGISVTDTEDLLSELGHESVGKQLAVTLIRAGERKELSVTITERAQQKGE